MFKMQLDWQILHITRFDELADVQLAKVNIQFEFIVGVKERSERRGHKRKGTKCKCMGLQTLTLNEKCKLLREFCERCIPE